MASSESRRPIGFEDRLLAEAVRACEEAQGATFDDRAANALARAADCGLEEKIVCRARAHPSSQDASAALGSFRLTMKVVVGLAAALALAAGVATAHTALAAPAGQPVNFHWALIALLGVETITLLLWVAFSLLGGQAAQIPSLGGATLAAARRLAGWFRREPGEAALLQSVAAVYARGAIVRWTLGAITHGLWASFLVGALVMVLLVLSAKQVVFGWETTILSEETYLPLTQALAALPQLAGFPTPSAAEVMESRWAGQGLLPGEAARSWAGLLIGSVLFYGLVPLVLLFALSLGARRKALRDFRLDLLRPAYVRLREVLMPRTQHEGPEVTVGTSQPAETVPARPLPAAALTGPFGLMGLEVDADSASWPPDLPGSTCLDLGHLDSREARAQALTALSAAGPSLVLVAVSLLTTPDRGIAALLGQVKQAATVPMVLLLTEGGRLERRYSEPARGQRYDDWRRLAGELQIPVNWVIEVDLTAPAAKGLPELTALLNPAPA